MRRFTIFAAFRFGNCSIIVILFNMTWNLIYSDSFRTYPLLFNHLKPIIYRCIIHFWSSSCLLWFSRFSCISITNCRRLFTNTIRWMLLCRRLFLVFSLFTKPLKDNTILMINTVHADLSKNIKGAKQVVIESFATVKCFIR